MAVMDDLLAAFQDDLVTSLIILGIGFLVCHLLHAVRYAFIGGYGSKFEKIKNFFKLLLFLQTR